MMAVSSSMIGQPTKMLLERKGIWPRGYKTFFLLNLATPADFFVIRKVLNSKFIKCSFSKAAQNSLNFVDTFTRTKVTAI